MTQDRFPYQDAFEIDGRTMTARQVLESLTPHITAPRRAKIDAVVPHRTFDIVTVCDNLYDAGNIAAVMRSAESMGVQELHVISRQKKLKFSSRITAGSDKWLDLHLWRDDPMGCVENLKARGYRIVATHLDDTAVPISDLDFTIPTAMVLGNEHAGVSADLLEAADVRAIIPMRGFAEGFNISVAAALSLYHITQDRQRRMGKSSELDEEQQEILRAVLYQRAHGGSERLLTAIVRQIMGEEE